MQLLIGKPLKVTCYAKYGNAHCPVPRTLAKPLATLCRQGSGHRHLGRVIPEVKANLRCSKSAANAMRKDLIQQVSLVREWLWRLLQHLQHLQQFGSKEARTVCLEICFVHDVCKGYAIINIV